MMNWNLTKIHDGLMSNNNKEERTKLTPLNLVLSSLFN